MEPTQLLVPALIFVGGMTYIAIDTVRIILMNRGLRQVAPFLGFVEVIIFLLAVGQVLSGPLSMVNVVAYAAGWACGTFIGMWMENRLALGVVVARVITQFDALSLIETLRNREYGITSVAARGTRERVRILFSVIRRKDIDDFIAIVHEHNPNAFISFEDVRQVRSGYFQRRRRRAGLPPLPKIRMPGRDAPVPGGPELPADQVGA